MKYAFSRSIRSAIPIPPRRISCLRQLIRNSITRQSFYIGINLSLRFPPFSIQRMIGMVAAASGVCVVRHFIIIPDILRCMQETTPALTESYAEKKAGRKSERMFKKPRSATTHNHAASLRTSQYLASTVLPERVVGTSGADEMDAQVFDI